MISYLPCLQILKNSLPTVVLLLSIFSCIENSPPTEIPKAEPQVPASNNIRNYLIQVSDDITSNSLSQIETAEEWNKIRARKLQEFTEMISLEDLPLNDPRSAPNVKITGTIQMDGYKIEKLYYESLPGLYVPANLYIPDEIQHPTAAILYLCGHTHTQKVSYQAHPHKLAQLGFVCLIPETIQYGEVRGEHWGCYANGWFNWYSKGYTPAGVEVWNGIRGLDLLSSRTEVDSSRIGITGISGGGAISWFLAAIDSRVKAAAPVCGASTLRAQITTRTIDGHCDCMMCINTYGWDIPDIGALIAPRPLMIAQSDLDGLNQIESVRGIYQRLHTFYEKVGASDKISLVETPGGHSYHKDSREQIFSFFLKHLKETEVTPDQAGDIDESPELILPAEELAAYTNGPPTDDITTTIQDTFVKIAQKPDIGNQQELREQADRVRSFLLKETFHNFPETTTALKPEKTFQTADSAPFGKEVYQITTEEGWRLRAITYWRHPKNEPKPMMLVLRNPDEVKNDSERFASSIKKDWNVTIVEVRGTGETGWAPNLQWHIRRAAAWTGRTIASMRVYDTLRFLEFGRSLPGISGIGIAAKGEMAVVALYAALLDKNCETVLIEDPPSTQNVESSPDGEGMAVEMLNCLRITDIFQLPVYLNNTNIVLAGEIPETYQWAIDTRNRLSIEPPLRVINSISQF